MKELEIKKKVAERKLEERKAKIEILKLRLPFRIHFQFNKFIVIFCISAIILYTIAAIWIQKNTIIEISPTLTTSVFAFFGTELIGLAGIKIFDTKFNNKPYDYQADDDESEPVG